MKRIGWRYEEIGTGLLDTIIVELTDHEYEEVKRMLGARDLPSELLVKRAAAKEFNAKVKQLNLSPRLENILRRGSFSEYRNDSGELLVFDEWVEAIMGGYREHGALGRHHEPFVGMRNFGAKSYLELIEALRAADL